MSIFGNENRIRIFQYQSLEINQHFGRNVLPIICNRTRILEKDVCLVTMLQADITTSYVIVRWYICERSNCVPVYEEFQLCRLERLGVTLIRWSDRGQYSILQTVFARTRLSGTVGRSTCQVGPIHNA
jgi:hypothetical protein